MKRLLILVAIVAVSLAAASALPVRSAKASNYWYIWNPCPAGEHLYTNVFGQVWCA